jgi:hypothetical protein
LFLTNVLRHFRRGRLPDRDFQDSPLLVAHRSRHTSVCRNSCRSLTESNSGGRHAERACYFALPATGIGKLPNPLHAEPRKDDDDPNTAWRSGHARCHWTRDQRCKKSGSSQTSNKPSFGGGAGLLPSVKP